MIGKISILVFLHCVYSLLRLRKYLSATQQQFIHIPLDISIQIIIGLILALVSIITNTEKFKEIRQFTPVKTYDASFQTKSLSTYTSLRTQIFSEIMKQKLGTTTFELNI